MTSFKRRSRPPASNLYHEFNITTEQRQLRVGSEPQTLMSLEREARRPEGTTEGTETSNKPALNVLRLSHHRAVRTLACRITDIRFSLFINDVIDVSLYSLSFVRNISMTPSLIESCQRPRYTKLITLSGPAFTCLSPRTHTWPLLSCPEKNCRPVVLHAHAHGRGGGENIRYRWLAPWWQSLINTNFL